MEVPGLVTLFQGGGTAQRLAHPSSEMHGRSWHQGLSSLPARGVTLLAF